MTIEFGDWRLIPMDGDNWELAHRHVTTRGKNVGSVTWHRIGRYYQQSTIANALLYAADWEMRNDGDASAVPWREYVTSYQSMLDHFMSSFRKL